ncbi:MAG: isoprenylcysteine carboxylmethyltransferase family protein [Planctomycetes bacterium]|jgi:protein-S-isoprenylcysteine O-methyltransferase Ste14|nr:isoprenylcysteine carboxylmethyltransferase family protein [Planctomycetota bacterium]
MSNAPVADSEPIFACSPEWAAWWTAPALRARVFDGFEKCLILALYLSFLNALSKSMASGLLLGHGVVIGDAMLLATETIMVVLVLLRRSAKELTLNPRDWAIALTATCLALLARPFPHPPQWFDAFGASLTIAGLMMQLYAKITLGRRFGLVAANRGICSQGPYRFVRHPIYFGYVMLHVGFFILNPSLWNLAVFGVLYAIKIPRILIEEDLLARDPDYRQYMDKVRYRLLPGVF